MIGLRNKSSYQSISAFSPIVNPMDCPWGIKALTGYLGSDVEAWQDYDATRLVEKLGCDLPILIEQGLADEFLAEQLKPENFIKVAKDKDISLEYCSQATYDHSYYFIASFIEKHMRFHARYLT